MGPALDGARTTAGWRRPALLLALLAFAAALYANSAGNAYVLDDGPLVASNARIRDLANLSRFFTSDYWGPVRSSGLYRPLVTTSYALGYAAGGAEPLAQHVINITLHALNSALVLLLLHRLTGSSTLSVAAAFLFAAHAVHAEAVANVAGGRPELMAGFFFLLALLAHAARWTATPEASRWLHAASLLAFALALLCKESAVTLIAGIYLADVVYGAARTPTWRAFGELLKARFSSVYLGYGLVAVGYLGVRLLVLGDGASLPAPSPVDNPLVSLPVPWRIASALDVALRYGWLLLFPARLSYDYSYDQIPVIDSFTDPRLLWVAVLSVATLALLAWSLRRSKHLFFALACFAVTFSVVSNAIVPIGTILGERLLYVPSIGFCLGAAVALRGLVRGLPLPPRSATLLFAVLVAVCVALHAGRTVVRNRDWRSEEVLWLHDLAVSPRSAKVQSNAGAIFSEQGRHAEALEHFRKAIEIAPESFAAPYRGVVLSLVGLGRYGEAAEMYQQALRFGPGDPSVENAIRQGLRGSAGALEE